MSAQMQEYTVQWLNPSIEVLMRFLESQEKVRVELSQIKDTNERMERLTQFIRKKLGPPEELEQDVLDFLSTRRRSRTEPAANMRLAGLLDAAGDFDSSLTAADVVRLLWRADSAPVCVRQGIVSCQIACCSSSARLLACAWNADASIAANSRDESELDMRSGMQNVSDVEGMLLDGSLHPLFQGARRAPRVNLVGAYPCVTSVGHAFACKEEYTALELHEAQTSMPPLVCEPEMCHKIVRCRAFSSFDGKLPFSAVLVCELCVSGAGAQTIAYLAGLLDLGAGQLRQELHRVLLGSEAFCVPEDLQQVVKSLRNILFLHYLQLRLWQQPGALIGQLLQATKAVASCKLFTEPMRE
jgi:hypothetical protein